jgi:hypothetical protein
MILINFGHLVPYEPCGYSNFNFNLLFRGFGPNLSCYFRYLNDIEVSTGIESTNRQSVLVSSPLTLRTRMQCVATNDEGKTFYSKIGQSSFTMNLSLGPVSFIDGRLQI